MSKSKELSEFDHGSIVGCHLCGKSVREIADILQKPKPTVSDVIVKWKRRGSETAEKRTGRPKILGERSRRILKRAVKQNSNSSLVEISQEFQSSAGISNKFWDELDRRLRSQPNRPSSLHALTSPMMDAWKAVPMVTYQKLVESLPKRVKATINEKGDQHHINMCLRML
ncbi:regulator of chromosome condensation 2 [Trichonephila clavipes]|nr:regulator of chromosome condensation 2 [Trichonephila clavipes]